MTVTVQASANLGLSKGQNRTVFRNPRGNKNYYALSMDWTSQGNIISEYSVNGVSWGNTPQEVISWINGASFDVKIRDDGSQLEVWVASIGLHSPDVRQTKYVYGTIGDSDNDITWNTVQVIDADIIDEGFSGLHCISLARTDNGKIVVAFTEDMHDKCKSYRLTKLIGSDGDGASPSWSGETTWDDSSTDSNNQDKDEVWFGLVSYSADEGSGNAFHIYARVPSSNTVSDYNVVWDFITWGGSAFGFIGQYDVTTSDPSTGKVLSMLIDEVDYSQILYWDGDGGALYSKTANTAGGQSAINQRTVTSSDVDACTITLDTSTPADVPTSDELVGGWTSTEGDLHSAVDEGYTPNEADYIDNTLDNACRLGGFKGGLIPVVVRAKYTGAAGGKFSLSTYKGGVLVESLVVDATITNNPLDFHYTPTDGDWDELYIISTKNASDSVRVFSLYVDYRQLYVFYHKSGDSVDWNYKHAFMRTVLWSSEKTVSYHQDITALSSWSRQVENSLHIAGLYGTTVVYNEHPVYKALSTTLADLEFPGRNYYLGPHST